LAWPAALASVLMNFAHIVDRMFIGELGLAEVTAVGFCGTLVWFSFSFIELIAAGTVAIVARYWGSGDRAQGEESGHKALWLGIGLAAVLAALLYLFSPLILRLYIPTAEQYPLAVGYMRLFAPGFAAWMVAFTVHSVFTGTGDTRTGMFAFVSINVLNVFLNWLLIFGNWGLPALGVRGAALATTISAYVGLAVILLAYRLRWSNASLRGFLRDRPAWADVKRFLRIGLPATGHAITRPLTGIAMMGLASRLTTPLPDGGAANYVASAFTIGMMALSFGHFFSNGLMAAPAPLVGQFLGRGEPERARDTAHKVSRIGVVIQAVLAVVYILFGRELAVLFLRSQADPAGNARVLEMAHRYLIFIGLGSCVSILAWTYGGAFRGAGDTKPPMWGALIANWVVKLPFALLAVYVFKWHDVSIWSAVFLSQVVEGLYVLLRFRQGRWMTQKV
jgi:putative MATE family efflux protein